MQDVKTHISYFCYILAVKCHTDIKVVKTVVYQNR